MVKIITYRPESFRPQRGANSSLRMDGLMLRPGQNKVEDAIATRLSKHPSFSKYKGWGALTIVDAPSDPTPSDAAKAPDTLAEFNVQEAEDLINRTENVELLQKWQKSDQRKSVQADLARRIKALTEAE